MENKFLHNEVLLVGRIISRQKGFRCNNKKAIRVKLAMPNDNDYNLNPNIAFVYFYEDDNLFKSLKRFQRMKGWSETSSLKSLQFVMMKSGYVQVPA